MDEDGFTRGEKSARDKACYLIVQLPWLLLHLPRLFFSALVRLVWGLQPGVPTPPLACSGVRRRGVAR